MRFFAAFGLRGRELSLIAVTAFLISVLTLSWAKWDPLLTDLVGFNESWSSRYVVGIEDLK